MAKPEIVLSKLKRTRRRPEVGDIIGVHVEGNGWLYCRVVSTTAQPGLFSGVWDDSVLLYVYRLLDGAPDPPAFLPVDDLLFPPIIVSRELWTAGYAMFLENRPFRDGEQLRQHCFAAEMFSPPRYQDEHGRVLTNRTEPCGLLGLHTPQGLSKMISRSLGLCSSTDIDA